MPEAFPTCSPITWPWAMRSTSMLSSEATPWQGGLLRRWQGTSSQMDQPPLDHHYLVMHLGGHKNVVRSLDGPTRAVMVESGSITFVPAGSAFRWRTTGPIDFAHLYLHPGRLSAAVEQYAGRDGRLATLTEGIGVRDSVVEALMRRMLVEIESGANASTLLLDSALECLLDQVATRHSSAPRAATRATLALAPHKLQRVLDYIEAALANQIDLASLAAVAGMSPSHFCHAFRAATGVSPYRYVLRRRIALAKVLLLTSDLTLEDISTASGFASRHQWSLAFKTVAGACPKRFRMDNVGARPRRPAVDA